MPHLSQRLLEPEYRDLLLYDWGIHHLHLGIASCEKDPRFVARTNELLYVRVEPNDLYCIDILTHDPVDGFANQRLISIIHDNWPHLLQKYRIIGVNADPGLTNDLIAKGRSVGVTTCISTRDGFTYFPMGGGYASDGSSIQATTSGNMLIQRLHILESAIKNHESKVRERIERAIGRCPCTIRVSLQSWDENGVTAVERKTKRRLKFAWADK